MTKVFVTGASGNVGSTIVRTIQTKDGFELVGGWGKESGQDFLVSLGRRWGEAKEMTVPVEVTVAERPNYE